MWTYFKIVMTLIKIPVEAQPISVLYWKRMNVCDHEQYLGALTVKKKKKKRAREKDVFKFTNIYFLHLWVLCFVTCF